jgi:hypothetical protein
MLGSCSADLVLEAYAYLLHESFGTWRLIYEEHEHLFVLISAKARRNAYGGQAMRRQVMVEVWWCFFSSIGTKTLGENSWFGLIWSYLGRRYFAIVTLNGFCPVLFLRMKTHDVIFDWIGWQQHLCDRDVAFRKLSLSMYVVRTVVDVVVGYLLVTTALRWP